MNLKRKDIAIQRYLAASRRVFDTPYLIHLRANNLGHYGKTSKVMGILSKRLKVTPSVLLTHSLQRRHAVVSLDGIDYLIVDLGLIELLHVMNCLYYSEIPDVSFRTIGCGYIAQQLQFHGLDNISYDFASEQHRNKEVAVSILVSGNQPKLRNCLAVQEIYAFYHESAHLVINEDSDYFDQHKKIILEQLKHYFGNSDNSPPTFVDDYRKIVVSRDIQEEFVAEDLSRILALHSYSEEITNDPVVWVESIFLAHLHLCVLDFIDAYIELFTTGGHLHFGEMQEKIGMQFLRQSYAGIDLSNSWKQLFEKKTSLTAKELNAKLVVMENKHRNVFIENFGPWFGNYLFKSVSESQQRKSTNESHKPVAEVQTDIDAMSGWPNLF
jgi:hypothetical protein